MCKLSSSPADDDVFERMHALMHQVRGRPNRSDDDTAPMVGRMEGKALGFFVQHPGATQSDLVTHSGRDKGQMARLIAGLKERGLLAARPDELDRRVIRLYPSAQALALHAEVQQQRRALSAKALAGLSATEKQQLLAWLDHMQRNLQAADDASC